jgi:hypothetical protein
MKRFDGNKNATRRLLLEGGEPLAEPLRDGEIFVVDMKQYRKTSTIYAVRMESDFEVDTLEGCMTGKGGDWLACGAGGELYPIDGSLFAVTYEEVLDERPAPAPRG